MPIAFSSIHSYGQLDALSVASALRLTKLILRHCTVHRGARSATLLVGSTPHVPACAKVLHASIRASPDACGIRSRSGCLQPPSRPWPDPHIKSADRETTLEAASGLGYIRSYHKERPVADRLQIIKSLIKSGEDVSAADNYGITPLMVAANMGEVSIIQ
jgi:hypothetical protein